MYCPASKMKRQAGVEPATSALGVQRATIAPQSLGHHQNASSSVDKSGFINTVNISEGSRHQWSVMSSLHSPRRCFFVEPSGRMTESRLARGIGVVSTKIVQKIRLFARPAEIRPRCCLARWPLCNHKEQIVICFGC
jgi:hypothetical protein